MLRNTPYEVSSKSSHFVLAKESGSGSGSGGSHFTRKEILRFEGFSGN